MLHHQKTGPAECMSLAGLFGAGWCFMEGVVSPICLGPTAVLALLRLARHPPPPLRLLTFPCGCWRFGLKMNKHTAQYPDVEIVSTESWEFLLGDGPTSKGTPQTGKPQIG